MIGRILSVGARSPLGLEARQIALAQRARKLAPRRVTFREGGASFGTSRASSVGDDVVGFERLVALAAPALAECLATSIAPVPGRVVLHLAVPDARPVADERIGASLLERVAGERLDRNDSTLVAGGHAGFAVALDRAIATSRATGKPVVAGAVDTYHSEDTLHALAKEHRLHGPGVADGFIPAEGAAFALVSSEARGARLAGIAAITLGADESDELGPEPEVAVAMTGVVDRALDAAGGPVDWVLADVNGERHRTKEWSFVQVRLRHRLDPAVVRVELPYQESGDVGAASGALYASYACLAWDTGFSTAKRLLIALRAEGAPRAAIVLEAP